MLRENYDDTNKLMHQLNSDKIELIRKESTSLVQTLLSKHQDELIAINAENDRKLRLLLDEKQRIEQAYEQRMKQIRDEFSVSLEQKQKEYDKKAQGVQKEMKEKYDKKSSEYKEKVKQQYEAINEENTKKFEEKLKFMFDKLHGEYEGKQTELIATVEQKQSDIEELQKRLDTYTVEIDKWKSLYLEACTVGATKKESLKPEESRSLNQPSHPPSVSFTFRDQPVDIKQPIENVTISPVIEPSKEVVNNDVTIEKMISPTKSQKAVTDIPTRRSMAIERTSFSLQKKEEFTKLSNVATTEKTTMTDPIAEVHKPNEFEKSVVTGTSDLDLVIASCCIKFDEKFQTVSESHKKLLTFYQNSLRKCITKIKEYQLYIENMSQL
jgi:hypothetical protein